MCTCDSNHKLQFHTDFPDRKAHMILYYFKNIVEKILCKKYYLIELYRVKIMYALLIFVILITICGQWISTIKCIS